MSKINRFESVENPLTKHIMKSFHAREDFVVFADYGPTIFYHSKDESYINLFDSIWSGLTARVNVHIDVRGSESPETRTPIRVMYMFNNSHDWENVYEGWVESVVAFDIIMRGIGLFGKEED